MSYLGMIPVDHCTPYVDPMNTKSRAMGALRIVLLGLLAGWVLYVLGIYFAFSSSDPITYGDSAAVSDSIDLATYFFLAAVAVFGIAALYGKQKAQSLIGSGDPHAWPVYYHAFAALIISTALGVIAVVSIFMSLLMTEFTDVTARLVNTYLPIVLFSALVVTFLLRGFVFRRALPAIPVATTPEPAKRGDSTRASALAYSIPIVCATIAAITAGLIYDFTGTSLTVWLWVVIFAFVGAGIIAGTYFGSQLPERSGAYGLNFAWVIAFTVVGSAMAFGYGAASVDYLHQSSGMSIEAYPDQGADSSFDASGQQLDPRSQVTLVLEPEGKTLDTFTTDVDGWFYETGEFPADLSAGEHTLTLTGSSRDGSELKASLPFTVEDSQVTLAETNSNYVEMSKTLPVTLGWALERALPALLLLLLVATVIHTTLPLRARAGTTREGEQTSVRRELGEV